jgi:hypothetical protein
VSEDNLFIEGAPWNPVGGWFRTPIWMQNRVREALIDCGAASSGLGVLSALCSMANERQSCVIRNNQTFIGMKAGGLHRTTVAKRLEDLQTIGILRFRVPPGLRSDTLIRLAQVEGEFAPVVISTDNVAESTDNVVGSPKKSPKRHYYRNPKQTSKKVCEKGISSGDCSKDREDPAETAPSPATAGAPGAPVGAGGPVVNSKLEGFA